MFLATYARLAFASATILLQAADLPIGTFTRGQDQEPRTYQLFESGSVTAGIDHSEVHLVNGGTIRLRPGARGTFYGDHMVLEQGTANVNLPGEYQVWAKRLAVQPLRASTAVIALLNTGNVALEMTSGSMRVLSDRATLMDLPLERPVEFAFSPQSQSSSPGPTPSPGGGPDPRLGGRGGGCPANVPVPMVGKLSQEGTPPMMYFTDSASGVKILLPNYVGNLKPGDTVVICFSVAKKANPENNTGLTVNDYRVLPENLFNLGDVRYIPGFVTKDKDGNYWIVDSRTGLKYQIVPGKNCDPDDWIAQHDKERESRKFKERHAAWKKKHEEWEKKKDKYDEWQTAYDAWKALPNGPKKGTAPPQPPKPGPEPIEPEPTPVSVPGTIQPPAKVGEFPKMTCVDVAKLRGQAVPERRGGLNEPVVITLSAAALAALLTVAVVETRPGSVSPSH
jgi:hypothetical protein